MSEGKRNAGAGNDIKGKKKGIVDIKETIIAQERTRAQTKKNTTITETLPTPTSIRSHNVIQASITEESQEQNVINKPKVESTDPAVEQAFNILKRKKSDCGDELLIVQEKAKIVKMITDKVFDCAPGSTVPQYNFRVEKLCGMVSSMFNHSTSSNSDISKSVANSPNLN
jgi:hypothetical protein